MHLLHKKIILHVDKHLRRTNERTIDKFSVFCCCLTNENILICHKA